MEAKRPHRETRKLIKSNFLRKINHRMAECVKNTMPNLGMTMVVAKRRNKSEGKTAPTHAQESEGSVTRGKTGIAIPSQGTRVGGTSEMKETSDEEVFDPRRVGSPNRGTMVCSHKGCRTTKAKIDRHTKTGDQKTCHGEAIAHRHKK